MTIKEVSEKTGISIDNLRYYERIGLLPEVPRNSSGIRNYDENSLGWIEFIICFKKGGMPLESIKTYIKYYIEGDSRKSDRKEILVKYKENLEKKIIELNESLDLINYKLETYDKTCAPITKLMVKEWKEKNK